MKLAGYVLRRVLGGIATVLAVATACFLIVRLLPGDPTDSILGETATAVDRAALRRALRLDLPLATQFWEFLQDLIGRGMGRSFRHPERTVWSSIAEVWPDTLSLALAATLIAWLIAVPLATISAAKARTRTDAAIGVLSMVGVAIPSLWLGPMLILAFCVAIPLLPFPGPDARGPASVVLPALSLGIGMAGMLTRMGRAALRDVLREPYVLAARARGLSESRVLVSHALRSAMVPLITAGGAQLTALLGGAIVTEKIFDRPGVGTLLLSSLATRDAPLILGCVVVIAATAVFVQLLVDIAYVVVDPRIRLL